ncbi:hypothetical protein 2203_scaffold802_00057 [Bacteriophage sp.]|nr:hypothetical protein 2203_scaffold802_00057 [Bacteriophage sp.]
MSTASALLPPAVVALLAFVVSRSAPEMTDGNQRPVAAW